jgi:hypothetical protein
VCALRAYFCSGGKLRNKGAIALLSFRKEAPPAATAAAGEPSWFWEAVDNHVVKLSDSAHTMPAAAPPVPVQSIKLLGGGKRGSFLHRAKAISHGAHEYPLKGGGWIRFIQFEAQAMPNASVPAQNSHALATLLFERREPLAEAYTAAAAATQGLMSQGSGTIPVSTWIDATQHVLGLRVPLERVFAYVLDEQRGRGVAEDMVDAGAFLGRFAPRCPGLTPVYKMRHCLFALLADKDRAGTGDVPMAEFEACCRTLHAHVDAAAAELCEPPARMLAACSAAGEGWVQAESVNLTEFEACFSITEQC